MIATLKLDDLISTGEAPREPDAAHGSLRAAVDEAHFFNRGHEIANGLSHFYLKGIWNSEAQTVGGSPANGGNHDVRCMAENGWPPRTHVINEFLAFDGEEAGTLGSPDKERLTANGSKSTNWRVYPGGDNELCALKKIV
jgi:hypothetical protein